MRYVLTLPTGTTVAETDDLADARRLARAARAVLTDLTTGEILQGREHLRDVPEAARPATGARRAA